MVQIKNSNNNNEIIKVCGCIQNDSIFRRGVVQIQRAGMNKLGDGKGIRCITRIWRKLREQTLKLTRT